MIRKGVTKNNIKFDKINQTNQIDLPHQTITCSPSLKHRLSLGSVITYRPSKKNAASTLGLEQLSIKQKQNLLKQLQQQITLKKQQNDAVQEAFRRRQQYTVFFDKSEQPQRRMKSLTVGTSLLVTNNKNFKRALFKKLRIVFRQWKSNKSKAVKLLLLWLMGWINNLFKVLGRSLII